MSQAHELLKSLLKLRAAESPDGKPPRAPTSPKQKQVPPGKAKGDKNRRS